MQIARSLSPANFGDTSLILFLADALMLVEIGIFHTFEKWFLFKTTVVSLVNFHCCFSCCCGLSEELSRTGVPRIIIDYIEFSSSVLINFDNNRL